MEKKIVFRQSQYLQEVLPLGCWEDVGRKKQGLLKLLVRRCQKRIDLAVATVSLTLMFLVGIWVFLIELAKLAPQL